MKTVGVLALQGAFAKHESMLHSIRDENNEIRCLEVRTPKDLKECDALIIPGGESTTMRKQMNFIGLKSLIAEFAKAKPIFGTCAGLILMARSIANDSAETFNLLDIDVERNGYGRQIESFFAEFPTIIEEIKQKKEQAQIKGVFIRAPRIIKCGPEVEVLATFEGEPVLVRQGLHLGATFHPELTDSPAIHRYFLKTCLKLKIT